MRVVKRGGGGAGAASTGCFMCSLSTSGLSHANMCSDDTMRRADEMLCRLRERTRCGAGAGERRAERLFVAQPSPVAAAKALKNPAELDGMREAHLRDSVAL